MQRQNKVSIFNLQQALGTWILNSEKAHTNHLNLKYFEVVKIVFAKMDIAYMLTGPN